MWTRDVLAVGRWLGKGCPDPPPNARKRQLLHELWRQHRPNVAVETGTFLGDTTDFLAERCGRVVTIELSADLAERARRRFDGRASVEVLEGDSGTLLTSVLASIDEPALIWLDGHWSSKHEGVMTARGDLDTPLAAEMQTLVAWRHAAASVIVVDDARLFGTTDYPPLATLIDSARAWGAESIAVTADALVCRPIP